MRPNSFFPKEPGGTSSAPCGHSWDRTITVRAASPYASYNDRHKQQLSPFVADVLQQRLKQSNPRVRGADGFGYLSAWYKNNPSWERSLWQFLDTQRKALDTQHRANPKSDRDSLEDVPFLLGRANTLLQDIRKVGQYERLLPTIEDPTPGTTRGPLDFENPVTEADARNIQQLYVAAIHYLRCAQFMITRDRLTAAAQAERDRRRGAQADPKRRRLPGGRTAPVPGKPAEGKRREGERPRDSMPEDLDPEDLEPEDPEDLEPGQEEGDFAQVDPDILRDELDRLNEEARVAAGHVGTTQDPAAAKRDNTIAWAALIAAGGIVGYLALRK